MADAYRPSRATLLIAAIVLAAAPFGVGVLRVLRTGSDVRYFWVALAGFIGASLVMLTGRARTATGNASWRLATVAFLTSTLFGVVAARLLGARAVFGILAVSIVMALFFTASHVLFAFSRPRA